MTRTAGTRAQGRIASAQDAETRAGREAADRLCDEWPEVGWVPDAPSEAWARGAVERLAELRQELRALFRAGREGAERGAETLSSHPFHGVIEVIQNADDLAAPEVRIAIQHGRRRKLLIVHDGRPVRLTHVGAMMETWVTTKADDPSASGRFGIGQKTLRSLGGPIVVHCVPFHFRIEGMGPVVCRPARPIAGLYRPERRETLLVVPLLRSVDTNALIEFVQNLSSRALLFLRSVRRLSLVEPKTGKRVIDHRLVEGGCSEVSIRLGKAKLSAKRLELRDSRSRRRYTRYLVERPLSKGEQRHHKATGPTTTLGIALAATPSESTGFYDRLPLPIPARFPFSLNAQFDPDTPRTALLEKPWNRRRLEDLGQLVAAVALDCFARDPASAWRAVPLAREVPDEGGEWLAKRLREHVVAAAQHRLVDELRIEARGAPRSLSELVHEEKRLDGLLTPDDQEFLAPDRFAVVPGNRDPEDRWRDVLAEFGRSMLITTERALDLFDLDDDELGEREPRWYVEVVAAAIDADLLRSLLLKRSVLLADGKRIQPPDKSAPRSLVCRADPASLAAKLDLALPLHPAYLADDNFARRVIEELKEAKVLLEECDSADAALQILAREPYVDDEEGVARVRVEDDQLLVLRDAFERLDEDEQRKLGPRIGRNIELRGFAVGEHGKRRELWVSPVDAYLPASIDRETDSFAKAATTTAALVWLDASYAKLLKREGGRREIGAQRFLVRLGAATAPRLTRPENERQKWLRDTRPASSIREIDRPELQTREIRQAKYRTHLLDDRWSPDLEAVIADIQSERNRRRRRLRALALLAVLARAWERHYADHERAKAVWGYNGYWQDPHEVIATWLARAATEPWLPSATDALKAPAHLLLPTEANRIAHRGHKSLFLAKVDDHLRRRPALRALRIKRGPSARSIVERLQELSDGLPKPKTEDEARTAYRLLALACGSGDGRGPVDDMSVTELRNAFAGGRSKRGLLLVDGRWYARKHVFVGRRIFGRYRPFLPASPALDPLWRTLQLRKPNAQDCLAVLRELANGPLAPEDRPIVLETFRALARKLDEMTPQLRARLRQLPLWTGESWASTRPVYALEGEGLAAAVAEQVPVWRPDFSSFAELGDLLAALGVTLLKPEDFKPLSLDGRGVVEGDDLRQRFALAIDHLRTELARGDQPLHDSIAVSWDKLVVAPVIVAEELELAATLAGGRRVVVPADAYVLREPLTFIVRSGEYAGTAEAGGRAIASLFSGDRQKVALAWFSMWHRAGTGLTAERIILPTDASDKEESIERLIRLQDQVGQRARRKAKGAAAKAPAAADIPSTGAVGVRQLRDLSQLEPDDGTTVNKGETRGSVIFPAQPVTSGTRARERAAADRWPTPSGSPAQRLSVLPPMSEREKLAYDAFLRALRLDPREIRDLRAKRGIGADAIDDQGLVYEIKMESSPEFPNEVTLTRAEADAAQNNADFFLTVVAGLEDGDGELRVRFIFDPLKRLAVRWKGKVTLSGVREVEALEYRFSKSEDAS